MQTVESSNGVVTSLQDGVFTITLNRPKVNAINTDMALALQAAFKQVARDAAVRCVLLTGSGDVFSAGQDLDEANRVGDISYRQHLQRIYNPLVMQIRQLEKPVLAAIQGPVSGAALGLVLACDLRMASEKALFVVGFLGIGLAPDSGVSLLLPLLVGLGRASELAFMNTPLSAEQALACGLVNRLAPAAQLNAQAFEWAKTLAQCPAKALGLTKRAFNHAVLSNLEEVLDYEAHLQEVARREDEYKQRLRGFLARRQ